MKKILSGMLAVLMLLGLFGCGKEKPEPTTEPAPQAADVYAQACTVLDGAEEITLDVVVSKTILVEGYSFTQKTEQVLTYTGRNTDAQLVALEKAVDWTAHEDEDEDADEEDTTRQYTEIYTDGTLYVEVEDEGAFSGQLEQTDAAQRYAPVILLDAALYGEVTMETLEEQTTISFAAPTAAEGWAMPADAQLQSASGTAVIGADGALQKMTYCITYQQAATQVTVEVDSTPRAEVQQVELPQEDDYTAVVSPEALDLLLTAEALTMQTPTAAINDETSFFSQAAGVALEQGDEAYYYDVDGELLLKVKSSMQYMDSENGSESEEYETLYRDGKLVVTADSGLPTQTNAKDKEIREMCRDLLVSYATGPEYWKQVEIIDLNGVNYLEFALTDETGNETQNAICAMIFGDATVLNKMASAYENKTLSAYVAIDKYTGLITGTGMEFEGAHTIEGDEYTLGMRADRAIEAPAYGAYYEITEEYPEEKEPEQKAQPLFYHVTGQDGQEMWLFGTIHVGDERTAFLPQEIQDAFAASDALALEFDVESFEKQAETDTKLQQKLSEAYYYSDDKTVEDRLEPELYELALKFMKASGNNSTYTPYLKIALWANFIENHYLRLTHTLHSEQGVEERLTRWAKEQEKPIRDVESGLAQSQMSGNWSQDLQILLLEDILDTDILEFGADVMELYELWCAGDEEALIQMINEEPDTSEMTEEELAEYTAAIPLMEEYEKGMEHDRNAHMLKVAIEYLESEDVVFYAVGLAHLLEGTSGLVQALRDAGYTVELVSYS